MTEWRTRSCTIHYLCNYQFPWYTAALWPCAGPYIQKYGLCVQTPTEIAL